MHTDSTTNSDTITVGTRAQNVSISTRSECQHPFCTDPAALGSDYCTTHRLSPFGPSPDTDITNPTPKPDPAPSRRELQRQLDRIEGKLDALLNED